MNEKILIVDDTQLYIKILTDILEAENYTVFSVDNGFSVLELSHSIKPDAILLDIVMPGLDGFEVCKILNDDYEAKDIPVIMVTARTEGNDIKNALEMGAFDYIKKPIDKIEVIARIQSALRLKNLQDKLKELAMKDSLTNLYNHAVLAKLLEEEISKQQRIDGNISFVMIDIDHFKDVNDTYGHVSGDIILKELSNILINSVRKDDIVGRYGGEEFSMVLPGTNKEGAFQLCERIRKKIEAHNFDIGDESIKITVSMGIFNDDSKNIVAGSEIIKKADKQLYKAKHNGRNKIEIG